VEPGRCLVARRIVLGEGMYMLPYTLSETVYLRGMIEDFVYAVRKECFQFVPEAFMPQFIEDLTDV
jgi:hypothetical protein